MLRICLFLTLFGGVFTAVSPNWEETTYVDSRTVTIVNNHQKTSGNYFYNITFDSSIDWPTLALSVPTIRVVSSGNAIHYKVMINDFFIDKFEMKLIIDPGTQVWHLDVRYYAIENSVALVGDYMQVRYFQQFSNPLANVTTGTGYRTHTDRQDINNVDGTHQFKIGTFVTGYQATSSDFYQVNITASLTTSTNPMTVDLEIEVLYDIALTNLYVYVIIADITGLAIQSRIFVETAITKSSYGDQYSYYTPAYGFYTDNYISGMASFSMRDNYQYNLTTSDYVVDDLTFLTSTTSKYDEVSHFNLYGRSCPAPYVYYSKTDVLCYYTCPDTTYIVELYTVCDPCDYSCLTCVDDTSCDTCQPNREILSGASLCTCSDYFYEDSNECLACHYSCETCSDDQYVSCLTCEASMLRTLKVIDSLNQTCPCDDGYQDIGVTRCDQICGDSKIYEDACDDGNTVNDDGCSSICEIQDYFTCSNVNEPSFCYYSATPTLKVVKIQKDPESNRAYFYMTIEPYVPAMQNELITDNFDTNFSLTSKTVQQIGDYIVLSGIYSEDLQDTYGRVSFVPSEDNDRFSLFNGTNQTLVLQATDGQKLLLYTSDEYDVAAKLEIASYYISCFILGSSLIYSIGFWKYMGNELFFAVQFAFMSYTASTYFTPHSVSTGRTRYVMGYNEAFGQQTTPELAQPKMQFMGYSVAYQYNFNIMFLLPIIALILYSIFRLALYLHTKKLKEDSEYDEIFWETTQGKILMFCQFDLFVYWVLISMQQIFTGLVLQIQYVEEGAIFVYIVICLIGIVLSILALILRPKSFKVYRKFPFHKHYGDKTFLAVLIATLFMDALLLISILVSFYVFYALLAFPLAIILYTIIQKPYKSMLNNIRLILVEASLEVVLILQVVAYHTTEDVFLEFPIGYLVCISFAWLITLIIWIIELVLYCKSKEKYNFDEDQEKESLADKSEISNESDLKENNEMEKKLKEINFLMFNQKKQGPDLPKILEMKNMDDNNNTSAVRRSRLPAPSPRRSNIKNQRELDSIFRNNQQNAFKSNRSRAPDRSDILDKSYNRPTNKNQNQESFYNDYEESERTTRMDPRKSEIRQPMNSARKRSNIYQDILNSTVSHYA